jgi:cell division protein FtsB
MRFWGTEDNVTRSGRTARPSRRQSRGRRAGSRPAVSAGGNVKNYPFLRQYFRPGAKISARLQRLLFFFAMAALIYMFVLSDTGAVRIAQLRLERAKLDRNIAELERNSAQLEASIARLQKDDFFIEKIGRERFNYVHPGERVYRIIPIDDQDF